MSVGRRAAKESDSHEAALATTCASTRRGQTQDVVKLSRITGIGCGLVSQVSTRGEQPGSHKARIRALDHNVKSSRSTTRIELSKELTDRKRDDTVSSVEGAAMNDVFGGGTINVEPTSH